MRLFAIVDIESTGSVANQDKITEIAVIITDGHKEIDRFETLINPQQPITPFVVRLTGITNEMVKEAPLFKEVAKELFELLKGKVFVAHNVNFDYKFIKQAFFDCGISFDEKRLCTVRLSREIIPGMASYNLGKLTRGLGIGLNNAHRAMPDTEATTKLFELMYQKNVAFIEASLRQIQMNLLYLLTFLKLDLKNYQRKQVYIISTITKERSYTLGKQKT